MNSYDKIYDEINHTAYIMYKGEVISDSVMESNNKIGAMSKLGAWIKSNNLNSYIKSIDEKISKNSDIITPLLESHPNGSVLRWQIGKYKEEIVFYANNTLVILKGGQWSPKSFSVIVNGNGYPVDIHNSIVYLGSGLDNNSFERDREKIVRIIFSTINSKNRTSMIDSYKTFKGTDMAIDPHKMNVYYYEK